MKWSRRYGLGLMGWVLFSMVSYLMPDTLPQTNELLWLGGFILGFALLTLPGKVD